MRLFPVLGALAPECTGLKSPVKERLPYPSAEADGNEEMLLLWIKLPLASANGNEALPCYGALAPESLGQKSPF